MTTLPLNPKSPTTGGWIIDTILGGALPDHTHAIDAIEALFAAVPGRGRGGWVARTGVGVAGRGIGAVCDAILAVPSPTGTLHALTKIGPFTGGGRCEYALTVRIAGPRPGGCIALSA